MKEILVGSSYFFSSYEDFHSTDRDVVVLVDDNDEFHYCREIHIRKEMCMFQVVKRDPKEHIAHINEYGSPMQIGKFLVPEFSSEIGFSFDDIHLLKRSIDMLDDRHTYEKIIYESYIKNGDFVLTQEQRDEAFEEYKRTRNLI
jgi:hypothetical protein